MIHKVFLAWLIYLVVVVLIATGLCYLDIPQIAIISDHSYLTIVLLAMYGISEVLSGRQAWKLSKEHVIAFEAKQWLKTHDITQFTVKEDSVAFTAFDSVKGVDFHTVPSSEIANHFIALKDMSVNGNHINQNILLDVLADHLNAEISIIEFVAARVVWVGILATILGVILAFWPLLGSDMAIETIRLKLGGFFSGIAVAFIPTAASFVFKIALDSGTKILTSGAAEIVNMVARTSETKLLPFLENEANKPDPALHEAAFFHKKSNQDMI